MDDSVSAFLDTHVLRVGPRTQVASALAIAPFVEVGRVIDTLDLLVAPQTLARLCRPASTRTYFALESKRWPAT